MADAQSTRTSDFALLVRWQEGDRAAGDDLFRRHYDRVLRFFELKAAYVADDLAQRTFLACVQGAGTFRHDAAFDAYLFAIARRQYSDHMRKSFREQRKVGRQVDDTEFHTTLSQLFARGEEKALLVRALAALPVDMLHLIQLHYWEQMRPADIATAMEASPSTISTRLARARERLRRELEAMPAQPKLRSAVLADLEGWTRALVHDGQPTPHGTDEGVGLPP